MVKVTRSPNPPPSLAVESKKKSGSYRQPDVIERLNQDFHGKCYLCEIAPLQSVEVEHLRSHQNGKYPERKFDWNNLFLSCPHCNSVKNQRKYDERILDCCAVEPEACIYHLWNEDAVQVTPIFPDTASEDVRLTAELITACFERRNTGIRLMECRNRFQELSKRMSLLYKVLERHHRNPSNRTHRTLRGMLDRAAPFAGFTRTYVRQRLEFYPDLAPYVAL